MNKTAYDMGYDDGKQGRERKRFMALGYDDGYTTGAIDALAGTVTAKEGVLWRNGKVIDVVAADRLAVKCGLQCAEQLVRHLEAKQAKEKGK